MSAINFSIPAPTNGLMIDHRNPPTTHIFNDVAIDGTIHKVVYICGDQMVYQPIPLPSQKNDNDIFYLSSDEDGLEGLDLLPPISSPKKKKAKRRAQPQPQDDAPDGGVLNLDGLTYEDILERLRTMLTKSVLSDLTKIG